MENKSMFKVTLKGAHEFNGKTEMVNKDFEGQLAVVITLRENGEKHSRVQAAIVGGLHEDIVGYLLLDAICKLIGEKDFSAAAAMVELDRLRKRRREAAEDKLNSIANSDDDVGQTPYGEGGDDE